MGQDEDRGQAPEDTYKTGVVIGKFYPPHRGHIYLIDAARSRVERLTVIVCDREGQTIPGDLRAVWLRELRPDVNVKVVEDIYDPDDSAVWAARTIHWLGYVPDAVFTSEDYGEPYARLMGSRHVLVDRDRAHVPCSGTAIRQAPLSHWDCLEPPARAYYAKRVCVVGAESSGSTTLARSLGEHYRTPWVPEYGRAYWEAKMLRSDPSDAGWRSEEFAHIAREQSWREDLAAREANRVLICDTDAFATTIWHERYMGRTSAEVAAVAAGRRYDLYLLTDVDIPFVQDGTRDGERMRAWMHRRFADELARRAAPYAVVSGPHAERMRVATGLVDALLG